MSTPLPKIVSVAIGKRVRAQPPVLGDERSWLKEDKEEYFCVLLCDGVSVAVAYKRAGFEAGAGGSASAMQLFRAPRIKARCQAIFAARKAQPAVELPEVTDMLKRVYVGALHAEDFSPAHNAAFSLARLHGLVVDRAQLDVIRRPSREPDAPAELALSDWISALPALSQGPVVSSVNTTQVVGPEPYNQGPIIEGSLHGSDLDGGPDGIENEAPTCRVTGTPSGGAHSSCGSPFSDEGTGLPSAEDLF